MFLLGRVPSSVAPPPKKNDPRRVLDVCLMTDHLNILKLNNCSYGLKAINGYILCMLHKEEERILKVKFLMVIYFLIEIFSWIIF